MRGTIFAGIYIHIPFCRQKCHYCDFPSYAGLSGLYGAYVDAVCAEISSDAVAFSPDATIFFGGGTPTVLAAEEIGRLAAALKAKGLWEGARERTIEANPGTINKPLLLKLRGMGFNRLSIGVQSFSDRLLKAIGRTHSAADALDAVKGAKEAGWENVGLDLMYGLPGQTMKDLRESVALAAELGLQHISVYGLAVGEGAALAKMLSCGETSLPDEETDAAMYEWVTGYLPRRGYRRYEIANYARPGHECRHNILYWQYRPYRGFGAAATSFDGKMRTTNPLSVPEYINSGAPESEEIGAADAMAEFAFMGLRQADGIDPADFRRLFGRDIYEVYGAAIAKNARKGLLTAGERIALTETGMQFGNRVFLTFLPFLGATP
ncbi:MAG: radical SAM family heme chaperone HemW [Acidaminococcales bacterium]|jgi:oxygen-independent coproporphyrinogen-3 oxidase|nr:radical SAM family heme chaperone HemW [Acidaminococcales bacterium]